MKPAYLGFAALLALLLVAMLAFGFPSQRDHHGHGHHHGQPLSRFAAPMEREMAKMMRDMHQPGYSGDADVDFLAMMIPHHQGAIDMARLVLQHGDDPLARRLAEDIIASQQAEIEAMSARLAILRRGPDPSPGGFPALGSTRGR